MNVALAGYIYLHFFVDAQRDSVNDCSLFTVLFKCFIKQIENVLKLHQWVLCLRYMVMSLKKRLRFCWIKVKYLRGHK